VPQEIEEARVFFGTNERKFVLASNWLDIEMLEHARRESRRVEVWKIQKVIPASPKQPTKVIVELDKVPPIRQNLQIGLSDIIATHVENGPRVNEHISQ
jgi:hypothetical protein